MPRQHYLITGTGRAGTTFLMQLLSNLGLDTGFDENNLEIFAHAKAGLEMNILDDQAPMIVKSPFFIEIADQVLNRDDIELLHVFIPMRDLYAAAESRRQVTNNTLNAMPEGERLNTQPTQIPGGLISVNEPGKQEVALLARLYSLMHSLSRHHVPVTLIQYPKLTCDYVYLFQKLKPMLKGIPPNIFKSAFEKSLNKEWVHQYGNDDVANL